MPYTRYTKSKGSGNKAHESTIIRVYPASTTHSLRVGYRGFPARRRLDCDAASLYTPYKLQFRGSKLGTTTNPRTPKKLPLQSLNSFALNYFPPATLNSAGDEIQLYRNSRRHINNILSYHQSSTAHIYKNASKSNQSSSLSFPSFELHRVPVLFTSSENQNDTNPA